MVFVFFISPHQDILPNQANGLILPKR